MTELAPLLTEYDKVADSEGSLDPLGLSLIADRLGTRLVPGVRERMRHPRFLTAMAAGAFVCAEFDDDQVAGDGITPPYQVYEWYAVQALVGTFRNATSEILGLPGREKATDAMRKGKPLCAQNYLKAPSVFGFHGVYRTLAEDLDILRQGRLGEAGNCLIRIWETEQDLAGFCSREQGPGSSLRQALTNAVKDGLTKSGVAREWNWKWNSIIAEKFAPYRAKAKENESLFIMLCEEPSSNRSQIIRFLISNEGSRLWLKNQAEKELHVALLKSASPDLRELLECIRSYEHFARLIQDAFDDCLWYMSGKQRKTNIKELAGLEAVKHAHKDVPDAFSKAYDRLHLSGYASGFIDGFGDLRVNGNCETWVGQLLEHHFAVQKKKPPLGKNPWIDRYDDNTYCVRPLYRRDEPARMDDSYVHPYRTNAIWSFLRDLKRVSNE
ncbi:MAG: hypothetical protein BROFUL_01525 [Candidatus Brocadia fulgida]|uniref:Uncharacterized protein n=1 Tax=Candidatus Brocadia fulgida TaxID=380242 RepID=A0A0M2UVC2_9BACT|nr:MAG: hypothetical protein BROFUL_01525 [Candidatus Brocadia fulgida]